MGEGAVDAGLVARLTEVRARVARACEDSGRSVDEVVLVAVTKGFPAADAAAAYRLGLHDLGESRDQEASAKVAEVGRLLGEGAAPRWHFVGRLQRNKCASVARYATVVHSVDRPEIVAALDAGAAAAGRTLRALVQVSIDGDPVRGGAPVAEVSSLADRIAESGHLELGGVMAVAPLGMVPDDAFEVLRQIHDPLVRRHPSATTVSAGMSGDLESAVRHGATCLRVGSALFGVRGAPVG